jgi:hypothetical protein
MKRRLLAAVFSAAVVLTFSVAAMAQTTRTFSLSAGDTITPASPGYDPAGGTTYYGGLVAGQAAGSSAGIFTLSLTFRSTGVVDAAAGIYGGLIVSPYSSFVVNQGSGRKTVSTSGSIDSGTVTYRLTPEGGADIISVSSNNLTVWEGKNKNRRAVGTGTLDYGTSSEGSGTLTLSF